MSSRKEETFWDVPVLYGRERGTPTFFLSKDLKTRVLYKKKAHEKGTRLGVPSGCVSFKTES